MTVEIWITYIATILLLMSTPGPSQLLMLSNSATHGFYRSLSTAAGDLSANILQMIAAGVGLAALITTADNALIIIKWLGVCYLIWLGAQMIGKAKPDWQKLQHRDEITSVKQLWLQGFITSAVNPKAVMFFAALFPQFIQQHAAFWPQFVILSATYIVIDGLFLSGYGLGASWIAKKFKGKSRQRIEQAGGSFMIFAAILLSLKTVENL